MEQMVLFESEDRESGVAVLDAIVEFLIRFVQFVRRDQVDMVALWVAHTHLIDAAESTPRLALISAEKQSAKTRLLELLGLLVKNPIHTSSCTGPALFHAIEERSPTMLVDEVDATFGPGGRANEELRAAINAGHRRGASVLRVGKHGIQEFQVFAPVAMAGIREDAFPDTIRDRALIIQMKRRHPGYPVEPLRRRRVKPEAEVLKARLQRWAEQNLEDISRAEPHVPGGITDRAADCLEPLLAIAVAAGGQWPDRARAAAVALHSLREVESDSIGVRLLADIRSIFRASSARRLRSRDLVASLLDIEEAPWGDFRGKPLGGGALARLLRPYGIKPRMLRSGDKTARGYERVDFEEDWSRYLPEAAEPEVSESGLGSPTVFVSGRVLGEAEVVTGTVTDVSDVTASAGPVDIEPDAYITREELDELLRVR